MSEARTGGSQLSTQGNTLAHELGHVLGLPHDGLGSAQQCANKGFIMQSGMSGAPRGVKESPTDLIHALLANAFYFLSPFVSVVLQLP